MDLYQQFIALSQIIVIDFVLAGDNAIVVGMAASRVHPSIRAKVIFWGVGGAVVLRILFAAVATQLLTIVGLTLAGGILLLWVCWKMYREITLTASPRRRSPGRSHGGAEAAQTDDLRRRADADRRRGCVDVARQRAGGGRRGQRRKSGCWWSA